MMFPKDGKYKCTCGYEEEATGKAQVFKTNAHEKEVAIVSENDVTLPKTRITCPQCGHTEAYFSISQTRSADEAPTRFYRCCKCNYRWREYS
jgi:DNA-directed RNA polymerase subunit M